MIATLGIDRPEEAHIRGEMHHAVVIARGEVEVRDTLIAGMARIHRKMRRALQLLIRTYGTKGTPVGEGLPMRNLKGNYGHGEPSLCEEMGERRPMIARLSF
jgi:hypothetical protein